MVATSVTTVDLPRGCRRLPTISLNFYAILRSIGIARNQYGSTWFIKRSQGRFEGARHNLRSESRTAPLGGPVPALSCPLLFRNCLCFHKVMCRPARDDLNRPM